LEEVLDAKECMPDNELLDNEWLLDSKELLGDADDDDEAKGEEGEELEDEAPAVLSEESSGLDRCRTNPIGDCGNCGDCGCCGSDICGG
jgi:hypothetical protein